ncbi:hypothetical protein NE237_030840 [Protea cynaroides]|uniref:Uncharacterized protein n=1 Tax=Protea cynaroides TaxID=273540 RepID=A0A9Q0GWQ0_9MAGN|nr:hypothetical protein NE237_030840 [Protea cynaroides]
MHQKKSEVQIGKESCGVSSDFNPKPPLLPIHHKHLHHQFHFQSSSFPQPPSNFLHIEISNPSSSSSFSSSSSPLYPQSTTTTTSTTPASPSPSQSPTAATTTRTFSSSARGTHQNQTHNDSSITNPSSTKTLLTTAHKRPIMNNTHSSTLSHSPTVSSLHHHQQAPYSPSYSSSSQASPFPSPLQISLATRAAAFRLLQHIRQVRRLRVHLRLFLLFSLPSFYFFLSNPRRSFLLDFLSALAFSAALLLSLNLALPRLPSLRILLARSFPLKLSSFSPASRLHPPVIWSIGSKQKSERRVNSGCAVQVYSNGDVYEGEFHKGKCSGSGVYYYYMSGRYEGDWVDEKYDGYGVETWARGSRYRGQYRHGLRHGYGVYRFYTGDVYAGEWSNGQSHGCGVHTCEDGSRYVGEFKWGVKHGLGHYHFRNGDTYAGEYFADKMHGFGVYRFANGHQYEGAWHEGQRQGLGMYTFRHGETQSGHWQNGVLDIPSTHNMHPGSPIAVNHSKVLNAVQEARRAAEKAYDVSRVDERVNKAVAAANKAANAARVASVKAVQKQMHHNSSIDDIPIPMRLELINLKSHVEARREKRGREPRGG